MLLMFEAQKRGGFSRVLGTRYAKANNKHLKGSDKNKQSNYLLYLDANNLYGWSMSQWEYNPDYYTNIPQGRGCI